jgi:hypothetical protein
MVNAWFRNACFSLFSVATATHRQAVDRAQRQVRFLSRLVIFP